MVEVTEAVGIGNRKGFITVVANKLLTITAILDAVAGAGGQQKQGQRKCCQAQVREYLKETSVHFC